MESCLNTEKDVDKLLAKFDSYKKQSFHPLDQLHEQVYKLKDELSKVNADETVSKSHQLLMSQQNKKLKIASQKLSNQHKDLHSSVSRIGKTIDRNFDAECKYVNMPEILVDEAHQKLLNTAICEHFYRQGSLSVAEGIAKECSLEIDDKWCKPFVEMNEILHSLRHKQVDHALDWAEKNKEQLSGDKSNLEFKLHRLKFLEIIKQGACSQSAALDYAKKFQKFSPEHSRDIQQLMGCFLYLKQGLSLSPYAHLLSENVWNDIYESFSQEACRMMGMSVNSPLMTTFCAGCQALPALVTLKSVIESRQCSGMLNTDELSIDIDLDDSQLYHSVIACPILRQQTTAKNPPLRLVCGHVISKDALTKLESPNSKVKCPYCPVEQAPGEAKEIFY